MADTTALVGGSVTGNITSCKIDTQQISTQVNGIFSFKENDTYRSYNMCTGQTVREYTVPSMTNFGEFIIVLSVIIIFATVIISLVHWLTEY